MEVIDLYDRNKRKLNKTFINKANEYLKEDSFIFLKTNAPFYEDDTFYYYLGDYFDDGENTAYKQYISDMKGFESTINDKNINFFKVFII